MSDSNPGSGDDNLIEKELEKHVNKNKKKKQKSKGGQTKGGEKQQSGAQTKGGDQQQQDNEKETKRNKTSGKSATIGNAKFTFPVVGNHKVYKMQVQWNRQSRSINPNATDIAKDTYEKVKSWDLYKYINPNDLQFQGAYLDWAKRSNASYSDLGDKVTFLFF